MVKCVFMSKPASTHQQGHGPGLYHLPPPCHVDMWKCVGRLSQSPASSDAAEMSLGHLPVFWLSHLPISWFLGDGQWKFTKCQNIFVDLLNWISPCLRYLSLGYSLKQMVHFRFSNNIWRRNATMTEAPCIWHYIWRHKASSHNICIMLRMCVDTDGSLGLAYVQCPPPWKSETITIIQNILICSIIIV